MLQVSGLRRKIKQNVEHKSYRDQPHAGSVSGDVQTVASVFVTNTRGQTHLLKLSLAFR